MDSLVAIIVAVVAVTGTIGASMITYFSARSSMRAQRQLSDRKADQEDVVSLRAENRDLRAEFARMQDDYVDKVQELRDQVYKLREKVWALEHANDTQ